tara:strand:+ start:195 stop:434 length:240 start_codon:yes stop_codon:yes gene_type:complete
MVPEQEVPDELVVTEVASIDSEKVTEMDEVNDTDVVPFDGLVDVTVGEVVSIAFLLMVKVILSPAALMLLALIPEEELS